MPLKSHPAARVLPLCDLRSRLMTIRFRSTITFCDPDHLWVLMRIALFAEILWSWSNFGEQSTTRDDHSRHCLLASRDLAHQCFGFSVNKVLAGLPLMDLHNGHYEARQDDFKTISSLIIWRRFSKGIRSLSLTNSWHLWFPVAKYNGSPSNENSSYPAIIRFSGRNFLQSLKAPQSAVLSDDSKWAWNGSIEFTNREKHSLTAQRLLAW